MDFLKNIADQAQSGSNQDRDVAGLMGGLNSVLHQKNAEGGQAPASGDQISNLMNTVGNVMNQGHVQSSGSDSNQVQGVLGQLQNTLKQTQKQESEHGSDPSNPLGGLMNAANNALGGGAAGEAKEDKLDKAIDLFQEHVLKAGDQSNESAIEQAKDAQIKSAIESNWQKFTGKDFPR